MGKWTIEIIALNVFKVNLPSMASWDDYNFTKMNLTTIVLVISTFLKVTCSFTYPIEIMWWPEKHIRSSL